MSPPLLFTDRLLLRPFYPQDAGRLLQLLGAPAVARGMLGPVPASPRQMARWIARQSRDWLRQKALHQAVTLRDTGEVMGAIGLEILEDEAALGYWLGEAYWHQGYMSEAAAALTRFGLTTLGLRCIRARHSADNPASGRVLEKAGLRRAGEYWQQTDDHGAILWCCYATLPAECSGAG